MNMYARRRARKLLLQAIYQWQCTQDHPEDLKAQYLAGAKPSRVDSDYFNTVLIHVLEERAVLDEAIAQALDRPLTEILPTEIAILRLAAAELMYCLNTPYKVIINEAVNIGKSFGSTGGHRYVNGVLDQLAKTLRPGECAAHT